MGGFKNTSLNIDLKQGLYAKILDFLVKGIELMVINSCNNGIKLENNEEKITAHLVEVYLNNPSVRNKLFIQNVPIKFMNEYVENFDINSNTYAGRVDIKVVSSNWLSCENNNDYYTIECKRIDGSNDLNKKYITQGVKRFVVPPIKYPSYHGRNIMLGYIVKEIDINEIILTIDSIHKLELSEFIEKDIQCILNRSSINHYIYESSYNTDNSLLLLSHLFYNLHNVVKHPVSPKLSI